MSFVERALKISVSLRPRQVQMQQLRRWNAVCLLNLLLW